MHCALDDRRRFYPAWTLRAELADKLNGVPGVYVGWRGERYCVEAPRNAVQLVTDALKRSGLTAETCRVQGCPPRPKLSAVSAALDAHFAASNELPPGTWAEQVRPFQRSTVARLARFGGGHMWIDPGGGKTLIGILVGCVAPAQAPLVIITRGGAREHHAAEVRRWTTLRPYVLRPEALQRKREGTVEDYLNAVETQRKRPVLIAGWELLPDHVFDGAAPTGFLAQFMRRMGLRSGVTLILDEAHRAKCHQRADWTMDEEGGLESTERQNRASAVYHLSRLATWRVAATATPISLGISDLWAQLDLIAPEAWGRGFWAFAKRYAGAYQGDFGMVPNKEPPPGHDVTDKWDWSWLPNVDELRARLAVETVRVPYTVSHGELPPLRRRVEFIPPEAQARTSGYLRDLQRAAREGETAHREVLLQESAARKRPWAKELIGDYLPLRGGRGKIVVMGGRIAEVVRLSEALRSFKVPLLCTHGPSGISAQAASTQFMAHPGPCIVVSSHQLIGESLDFHDADLLLPLQLPTTPLEVRQREGRVARIGQQRPVDVVYGICEESVDERLAELLNGRLPTVAATVGDAMLTDMGRKLRGTDDVEGLMAGIESAMKER